MPHTRLIQVLDDLAFLGDVHERRMFGGYGLYLHGMFFGLITSEGEFFLKADATNKAQFEKFGSRPFSPDKTKKPMNYWLVAEEVLADGALLQSLASRAVRLAQLAAEAKESPLRKMRNLGEQSVAWLLDVGIRSPKELEGVGAVGAYRAVVARGHGPSLNLLWALDGAIRNKMWSRLPEERKAELQAELEAAGG
jgi:DNA transformation protein and related proteins